HLVDDRSAPPVALFLIEPGADESGSNERRQRSEHQRNHGVRREKTEGAPRDISQAYDKPPGKGGDKGCSGPPPISRSNRGIKPQNRDALKQIKHDVQRDETRCGSTEPVLWQRGEGPAQQRSNNRA